MPQDDGVPHALVGRAGLVFAYVCFLVSITTLGAAIYLLPLDVKAKAFLAAAALLLTSIFVFMAIAAHLVLRPRPPVAGDAKAKNDRKDRVRSSGAGADGSHRPR